MSGVRAEGVTPHIAQNITAQRGSKIDGRTTRHPGYARSQKCRKQIEEIFGLGEDCGWPPQDPHRGVERTGLWPTSWPPPTTWSGWQRSFPRWRPARGNASESAA